MAARAVASTPDPLSLLAVDHRQVEAWFTELQSADSMRREEELAFIICAAIRRHTQMDKSLVYPAFLEATGDTYKCQATLEEEREMMELVDEIESSSPAEDCFFAKIYILCVMFKNHVLREEQERGMFSEVKQSGADLLSLGLELDIARKSTASRFDVGARPRCAVCYAHHEHTKTSRVFAIAVVGQEQRGDGVVLGTHTGA